MRLQNGITLYEIVCQFFGTIPHSHKLSYKIIGYQPSYLLHMVVLLSFMTYCNVYTYYDDPYAESPDVEDVYSSDLMQTCYDLQWYFACFITLTLSLYTSVNQQSFLANFIEIQKINKNLIENGLRIATFDTFKLHLNIIGAFIIIRWIVEYVIVISLYDQLGINCPWQTHLVFVFKDTLPILIMVQYIKFIGLIKNLMRTLNNAMQKINNQMRREIVSQRSIRTVYKVPNLSQVIMIDQEKTQAGLLRKGKRICHSKMELQLMQEFSMEYSTYNVG